MRFVGHAPLEATVFEMERLRCNACGEVFTADEPEAAGPAKYDETAVAMIALLKYGTGVPFKRLERLQGQLGMPLPAATQWELMAAAAKPLRPALEELIRQAAQGSVMHNDDTSMRILRLTREPGDKRTGTFTSGIVSLVGAWTIALFFTGWKHAGENIAEVLKQRAQRTAGANPDVRCAVAQHTEGRRNPDRELPRAWKTAGGGGGRSLSGRMPICAGDAGRRLSQRCSVAGTETVAGRPAALPSGAQRALDERAA